MESSPPSYDNYGGDKDKGSESKSESPKAIRMPLPASEIHASEPQRPERIIPLFQKFGEKDKEAEAEESKKKDKAETPDVYRVEAEVPTEPKPDEKTETTTPEVPAAEVASEHAAPHRDLAGLEHDLWDEFDNTPPAVIEQDAPAQGGGTATLERERPEPAQPAEIDMPQAEAEIDEADTDKQFFEIANAVDPKGEFKAGAQELARNDEKEQPEHVLWDESHTLHINMPSASKIEAVAPAASAPEAAPAPLSAERAEDAIAAAPSVEAMAAEVAATEPDDPSSVESLNRLYYAPAAEVAADHPEAYGEPLPPMTEQEQFQDIMQRADMGPQFERATSEGPTPPTETAEQPSDDNPAQPAQAPTVQPLGYYRGGNSSGNPAPVPVAETRPQNPVDDDPYAQKWYPPRYGYGARPGFGGPASMVGRAAEAAALSGMMGGAGAAHMAEAAAAGGIVGGIAGGVAGYEAGKHAAHRETSELKQTVEQQDQHITTLTNEQRVTHEQVDQLTTANQRLGEQQHTAQQQAEQTSEQQKKESAEAAAMAAAVAAERVQAHNPDEKVVRSEWVDMVVDKRTGRLVERSDVNNFGAELKAEQRHNTAPPDPLGDALAAAKAAAQATADISNYDLPLPLQGAVNPTMMGSGQLDGSHELPAGYGDGGMVDPNHRLSAPRNPLVTALSSPLLWVGVIVLVLAFFAAAFL
jgi:hypothetical protein